MNRLKEESGQVLVMTALSITVLLGFMAFATDVGLLLRERRMLQTAADSAAIAGAAEALYEGTPMSVTSECGRGGFRVQRLHRGGFERG